MKQTISGVIQVTRNGRGFVPWEGNEDLEIKTEDLGGALNGDTVEVELTGIVPRPKGKVKKVVERAKTEFVATLKKGSGQMVALPADPKFYRPIYVRLTKSNTLVLEEGTKVLIKLLSFDGKSDPVGEIIEVIGQAGEHQTEMNAIVLEHGFKTEFGDAVKREAEKIEKNHAQMIADEASNRANFRSVTTFTIDPVDAKDYDDALSIKELENGEYEIGVHIADVTHFVREGMSLEEEARKRGTSVYLVDQTIPMLPHELSGNVCSLREGEDRLVFSAVFKMDKNTNVLERRFEKAIINSNKRFTYEEAQRTLDLVPAQYPLTRLGAAQPGTAPVTESLNQVNSLPYQHELQILWSLAQVLRKNREVEGAIDFGDNEVRFELDKDGKPLKVVRKERINTNLLIEEFMLLANREVATYISKLAAKVPEKNLVFLYRIHDEPKADRIEELATFVRAIGYEFGHRSNKASRGKPAKYSVRDISKLLKDIEGKPEASLIRTATLRSMAKAIYSTKNIGHFGLAFEYYTHFTSPIRRYPDMLVHRILASHLSGSPITSKEFVHLERLCLNASESEAKAVNAERDSIRYKLVEYMQSKVGQTFDAVISGVTDWGLYVEEKESSAEGLVRVATIGNDFYNYSSKEYALVGQRTKKKYALGDAVRVRLTGADLSARTLDFELA